ncbi:D-amino-acid transaminase [Metabacillus halosaccharovorans]|uniref:D-alanine aminotransferase n=1 Tax=Metabacillus halosaccharovorans TaxID=930124 RepID=A0ABT3DER9_9BACI|nr:D-amino-acid transaminase [Metabacillus halosaccharovorans]MCV9885553.1 D-amino-acid transaminase [Metabacillus halosaccharovorans]
MKKFLVNDQFMDENEVKLSIYDRGYQFGDGVYEVIRFYNKKYFKLKEHLIRYIESARKIDIDSALDLEQLESMFEELLERNSIDNGYVYTQLTRGTAPRSHIYNKEELKPQLIAYVEEAKRPLELMEKGASAILHEDERWTKCDIKSLNLLGSVLAKTKANKDGAFEAILHRGDIVTEGSVSNVFVYKHNKLYTSPANNLILNGITRLTILEIAKELGIEVEETTISVDFLLSSDEVFTSATVSEITPIIEIKGKSPIGHGKPGEMTKLIQTKYEEKIKQL